MICITLSEGERVREGERVLCMICITLSEGERERERERDRGRGTLTHDLYQIERGRESLTHNLVGVSWRKMVETPNCVTGALAFSAIPNVAETQRLNVPPLYQLFPSPHHLTVCIRRETEEKGGERARQRDV
jgi:hypothetical protein